MLCLITTLAIAVLAGLGIYRFFSDLEKIVSAKEEDRL